VIPPIFWESEMRYRTAVEEFLRFCAFERQLSAHTVQAYAADLADFSNWLGHDRLISEITPDTLKEYLEHLFSARKLAVTTVRRRFACLRAIFRRISERQHVKSPFADWRPLLPRRKRLPRALTRSEALVLLRTCRGGPLTSYGGHSAFRTMVRLMVATGMRVGELCKLKVEDVSPDGAIIRIQGKGARDRVAYVTDANLRQDVCELRQLRDRIRKGTSALFLNRCSAPIRPQSVRSKLRHLARQAGFTRNVTPHMLRHTAATLLIETGVDIRFVQRLLGHSSIATTEIYTHISDEALRLTLERADVLRALS
jgi:site-specific recombinase XerD